jgi:hypothetical protein
VGKLHILGPEGDVTIDWDPEDAASVKKAKDEWKSLKDSGFEFFDPTSKKPKRIKRFSKSLGRVIAAPGVKSKEDKKKGTRGKAMSGGPNNQRMR